MDFVGLPQIPAKALKNTVLPVSGPRNLGTFCGGAARRGRAAIGAARSRGDRRGAVARR
jgi:hypothetical protein